MKFTLSKKRAPVRVTLLACLAFLALAVYGWDVSTDELLSGLLILLVCLVAIIILAAMTVALISVFKKIFSKN